ncbi:hypothetical protein [Streptomyces noursei]|uniref:hypothetical protein n=1 Tax=Streptomyces noursei TaxID=1971 RepID=UPI0023B77F47|nr:hypothetical protein [Streptomyces noursei]
MPSSLARRTAWIRAVRALLRAARRAGTAVPGSCLGAQAPAAAPAGVVELAPLRTGPEPNAHRSAGTGGVRAVVPVPRGRRRAPSGARELARSEVAPPTFTLGRSWGVQRGPELMAGALRARCAGGGPALVVRAGVDPQWRVAE